MRVSLLLRCCRDLTGSSSDRTRNGLRKKLNDSMNCFTDIRQFITAEYKETVERRYYTVTGEKTDESTIDWLIATGCVRDRKVSKFEGLKQGNLNVAEYEAKFTELARFSLHIVDTDHKKARKFENGLRNDILERVNVLKLHTYVDVLD
ncbi:syntaxin-123-like [Camellia sinensis]|uniref:syntaxin-123-like n=1 Tax=Camellia sinensis TaxID=4442 RepID=UPI001035CE0E|nr:syntaxin-123-like [Camellia sinensis]